MAATLPHDFLTEAALNIVVSHINFPLAGLDEYDGLYAVVLDNVLSPEECDALVHAAESTSPQGWERALINIGGAEQVLRTDTRNCGRIIWDSRDVVAKVWNRIAHVSEVQDIVRLENVPHIFGNGPAKRGEVWRFTRPNERTRFLKYTGGEYFRPHCDGSYETPDGRERSYVTLHLYLNTATVLTPGQVAAMSAEEAEAFKSALVGGATTFHSYDDSYEHYRCLDIMPQAGRVLLFQHRDLIHSGEDVIQGVKLTLRTDLMYTLESTKSTDRSKMPVLEDDWDSDLSEGTDGMQEAQQLML